VINYEFASFSWDYEIAYKFFWPKLIYLCVLPIVYNYFVSAKR
jgi:hypothetical protein